MTTNTQRSYDEIWFTSDPHYGHANIIKYCNRPFFSPEEMNEALIANWNSVVAPGHLVYVIGDLTMGYKKDRMKTIFDRLNGTKILIKGNHDHGKSIPVESFLLVDDRIQIEGEDYNFILVHDPAEASANHMDNQKYLCGHLHSSKDRRMYYNWIDVGVDANDFTPVSLTEILKRFDDETKKGLSADELLLRSTSSYNKYVQRRSDTSRTPRDVQKLL